MTAGRVSPGMKRVSVVVALAVIAGAVWYLRRPSATKAMPDAPPAPAKVVAGPGTGGATPTETATTSPHAVEHIRRLATPEERQQLAERIAAARTARAAVHAPERPHLPAATTEVTDETPISKTAIRDAMREVIPLLTECYDAAIPSLQGNELELVAELTLTGDPDVGTLIDAKELADRQGNKLPAKFDDCLRSTFQSLALPPLAEGDTISVHYPFVFSH